MYLLTLPFPSIDPVAVQLGSLQIHWYGIAYVAGFLCGWFYAISIVKNQALWGKPCLVTVKDIDDVLIWVLAGVIIGGRLGYILFYGFNIYLANPYQIFLIWQGGMSFHGGLIGSILAIVLFAYSRGLSALILLDISAAAVPFGLFFGRIANFINSELYGKPTNVPWSFIFPTSDGQPRHPTQLYEAILEGFVIFCILRLLTHRLEGLKKPGTIAGTFMILYGIFRIIVEFFRLPDNHIGYLINNWVTMGMILSLPMIIIGIWALKTHGNQD